MRRAAARLLRALALLGGLACSAGTDTTDLREAARSSLPQLERAANAPAAQEPLELGGPAQGRSEHDSNEHDPAEQASTEQASTEHDGSEPPGVREPGRARPAWRSSDGVPRIASDPPHSSAPDERPPSAVALDEAGLDEAGLDEAGLDEAGLDEAGLDEAGLDEAALDEAGSVSPAEAAALGLPCSLRLEWEPPAASHPGCSSLSALPQASLAEWDGAALRVGGELWVHDAGRLERMRRCAHEGTLWRFAERVTLAAPLAPDQCPEAPVLARYDYDECPLLSPGTVCGAAEPSACRFEGSLTLTPVPPGASAGGDTAARESAAVGAAFESEASCRPVGRGSPRPRASGESCFDGECAAGDFCSRELPGGQCAPLGEGVCAPAPDASACEDGSDGLASASGGLGASDLCLCGEPPVPLARLAAFDPARPGALAPSLCAAHALGLSVVACAAE